MSLASVAFLAFAVSFEKARSFASTAALLPAMVLSRPQR